PPPRDFRNPNRTRSASSPEEAKPKLGAAIDPAGRLETGEEFTGIRELKKVLKEKHRMDFYRCLTEKLMTYALGRGLEYYDTQTVDQIVARLERENGHFSALLMGIIESAPFQRQRDPAKMAGDKPIDSPAKRVQKKS